MIQAPKISLRQVKRKVLGAKRIMLGTIPLPKLWLMHLIHGLPSTSLDLIVPQDIQIGPPILDDICLPPYYGRWKHDDFDPLIKIAKFIEPRIVVEFGTAHGNIVANICRNCPEAKVYTVNALLEEQTGQSVTFKLPGNVIGRVYRAYGFTSRTVQIFKNTLAIDLSEYFSLPVIDLAIIDACHDTDYVINDFFKISPFVRNKGIILFHDTHPSMKGHLRGSYVACMQLRKQGFDIKHISGTWWAIWSKQ